MFGICRSGDHAELGVQSLVSAGLPSTDISLLQHLRHRHTDGLLNMIRSSSLLIAVTRNVVVDREEMAQCKKAERDEN